MTGVSVRAYPKQTTRLWHTTSRPLRINLFQLDGDFVIIDKQRVFPGSRWCMTRHATTSEAILPTPARLLKQNPGATRVVSLRDTR